jgi:hypothetical protein
MRSLLSVSTRILAVAVAAAGVLLPGTAAQAAGTPPTVAAGCTINLVAGTHNCSGAPGIFVQSLAGGRLLLRLTFAPGQTATFSVVYNAAPSGWTVNIGDSATNDGGGGDAATQSNDAETQFLNQQMSVIGRDGTPYWPLASEFATLRAGSVASYEVANNRVCWNFQAYNCLNSTWLYALNGQADTEGPVNYNIYAAFNRVVSGRTDRVGSGVSSVSVSLN